MYAFIWFGVGILVVFDRAVAGKISHHQARIPPRGYNFTSITTCIETRSQSKFSRTTDVSYLPRVSSSSVEEHLQPASVSSSYDPYPPVFITTRHAPSLPFHLSSTVVQSSTTSRNTQPSILVVVSDVVPSSSMWTSPKTTTKGTSTTVTSAVLSTSLIASIVPQLTSTLIPAGRPISDVNSLTVNLQFTASSYTPQLTILNTSIQLDLTTFQTFTFSKTSAVTITFPIASATSVPRLPQFESSSSSVTRSVLFPFVPPSTLELASSSTISTQPPATTAQPAPILFGTQILSQDSYSNLIFGSHTLLAGSAITVDGQLVTLASSGNAIIINPASAPTVQASDLNSKGVTAQEVLTINPTTTTISAPAVIIVDGSSITANPSTGFVIGTQTLYPGNKITESGEVLTLPAFTSARATSSLLNLVGNGTTSLLGASNPQTPSTLVMSTVQAQITSLQIAGQILTQGGVVTILDEVLSLVSGSAVVVVKTVDIPAPAASTSTGTVHKSGGRKTEALGSLLAGFLWMLVVLVAGC